MQIKANGEYSDTRLQLKSEPMDERWIGKKPKGHDASSDTNLKTIENAKKEWGLT